MYDAVLSETITITGHEGDAIEAYSARPLAPGPVGGVVVVHHLPGYDRQTKEFTRSLAVGGFNAVMPNLYFREAPGADPDDAMAAARARGAIPVPCGRDRALLWRAAVRAPATGSCRRTARGTTRRARWTRGGGSWTGSAATSRADGRSFLACVRT